MDLNRLNYYPATIFLLSNLIALFLLKTFVISINPLFFLVIFLGLILSYFKIHNIYKFISLFISLTFIFIIFYYLKPEFDFSSLIIKMNFQRYLKAKLEYFSELDNYNFLNSVILGNREYLKNSIKNSFSLTGSYHFLAISGLHFGIIASILHFGLKFIKSKLKYAVIIFLLFFYLMAVEFYISATRAFLMILIFYLGKMFNKKTYSLNIWSLASLIILMFQPSFINSLSFWMSVLATLGIILSLEYIKNINNIVLQAFFISVSAQIFLLPILLTQFNHFNIVSPVVNTIGIIFIYPILIFGFFLILPLPLILTKIFISIVEPIIELFINFISFFNREIFIVNFQLEEFYIYLYYCLILILFFYFKYILERREKKNF